MQPQRNQIYKNLKSLAILKFSFDRNSTCLKKKFDLSVSCFGEEGSPGVFHRSKIRCAVVCGRGRERTCTACPTSRSDGWWATRPRPDPCTCRLPRLPTSVGPGDWPWPVSFGFFILFRSWTVRGEVFSPRKPYDDGTGSHWHRKRGRSPKYRSSGHCRGRGFLVKSSMFPLQLYMFGPKL